jgi:transposase
LATTQGFGRQRNLDVWTKRLRAVFHVEPPRQLPLVEQAMGQQVLALLKQLEAALKAADDLAEATVKQFRRHPDHQIITSFPGLGELTGARVLPRDRRRPQPVRGRSCREGLRRRRAGDPSQWQAPPSAGPQGQKTNDWPASATSGRSPP